MVDKHQLEQHAYTKQLLAQAAAAAEDASMPAPSLPASLPASPAAEPAAHMLRCYRLPDAAAWRDVAGSQAVPAACPGSERQQWWGCPPKATWLKHLAAS
mmetsp:Transcript_14066/g.30479  ORF Transcript_14066/g.30479 Transcript_14066/m.30479 type:complete len:100 (-) Transcript_14066:594-893(-)